MRTLSPFDPVRPQPARLALLAAAALAAASPGLAQETERASLDPSGAQFASTTAFGDTAVDVSDDGSLCCFYATPIGGSLSLYTRNLVANTTATLRPGVVGYSLAMSGDGKCVVWSVLVSVFGFPSFLAPGDTNGAPDIYKFPTDGSAPIWVSVSASGGAANQPSWDPDVSWDGNLVTFSTYSGSNMTANPSPPGGQQVYLRDIPLGETKLISVTPGGSGGSNGSSNFPVISDTGRYVAFQSDATDLVPGDTNNQTDIFVWDDLLSKLTLVSRTDLGAQANHWCVRPSISADGRFVLYYSSAGNLSPDSQFGLDSLYVLDRDPDGDGDLVNTLGVTTMVSRNSLGVPVYGFPSLPARGTQLSNDGTQVLFNRYGDGLELKYTDFIQVWLHDRTTGQTTNVHVDSGGLPANHSAEFSIALAGGGSRAVYLTNASNLDLVLPDTNGQFDVYAHSIPSDVPVADAGPDLSVDEGDLVVLDGTASSGPPPLTFAWSQVAGPGVVLADPLTATPSFIAPLVGFGGETLSFQLTVTSGAVVSAPDVVNVSVNNVNLPPMADAGPDIAVSEGSSVTLSGLGSFDPNADALAFAWSQVAGPGVVLVDPLTATPSFIAPPVGPAGTLLGFELAVSDGEFTAVDAVGVSVVNVNVAPVAESGADQTVDEGTVVQLDGSASSDSDGDPLTFAWTQVSGPAVVLDLTDVARPTFAAPLVSPSGGAQLSFELVVDDGLAASLSDVVTVNVLDANAPPDCSLAKGKGGPLWPANHKLVLVQITGISDPDSSKKPKITIDAVYQDELVSSLEPGDTGPDAVIVKGKLYLRAERADAGDGRVYHVHFTATDVGDDSCSGVVTFSVPKKKQPAIDGGELYDSFGP